ncbi:elongin-c [Anaeramoeba flamelloides]|uniref:Elongin-C n=1 Tax=Anaeramoeba flamelloides TaxID=1746091 RepID=A0AAV8A183_9EUKA|nr:elongin-c [Anaeramoeba flamelloides]
MSTTKEIEIKKEKEKEIEIIKEEEKETEKEDKEIVTLVSNDEKKFELSKDLVLLSGTLKAMLTGHGSFREKQTGVIQLKNIRGEVLKYVVEYLKYKKKYQKSNKEIPQFDNPTEIALELLMAANFLEL